MAKTLPDTTYQTHWERNTEDIIAMLGVVFALFLFGLNLLFGLKSEADLPAGHIHDIAGAHITEYAYWLYPLICGARVAWVRLRPSTGAVYAWTSALIDIVFLTIIIYAFSLQYQNPAASLMAPTYSFYYVIIALHAMRFQARLVVAMGVSIIAIWAAMLLLFLLQGAYVTQSYSQYISSTDILIGSEVEKLLALGIFSFLLAFGVKRAKDLLSEASEKKISDVKRIETEKASRVKTEFLATMSHELRTPLNGVLGMSEVLKTTELSPKQKNFVDIIEKSGEDLLSIIEDILDFTQLESGETTAYPTPFQLSSVITKVDKKLRSKAYDKSLKFIIETQGAENTILIGDETGLKRILTNLLGNAIKFTQQGYVSLHIKTELIDSQNAKLSISVQDSGIGIAEEHYKKIFEKFSQADNSKTREYGGAGLGLSISQSLARAQGGEIKLDSQLGEGSRFYFDISLPYKAKLATQSQTQTLAENKSHPETIPKSAPKPLPQPSLPASSLNTEPVPISPQSINTSPINQSIAPSVASPAPSSIPPSASLFSAVPPSSSSLSESADASPIRRALIIADGTTGGILKKQLASLRLASHNKDDVREALTNLAKAFNTNQPYEILIIDCNLPGLNTLKLINLLRSKKKLQTLKIIALYSQDNQALMSKLDSLDITLLAKPYNLEALQSAMAQATRRLRSAA